MESAKKISNYYVTNKLLGKGSYGSVFLGYKETTGDFPYAIKIIGVDKIKGPDLEELKKSVPRELDILLNLDHPNIVKLYEFILSANNLYLVYEYCNGQDLDKYRRSLENGYLSEKQTLVFMRHICSGFDVLFKKDIIHRDLKPANILIHDGEGKIADFGTARKIDKEKLLFQDKMSIIGSPAYMAPEVIDPEISHYDDKCDIWSFGMMIYELLYRERPWKGVSEYDLLENQIKKKDLVFPKEPKRTIKIKDLLKRMLKKDPKDRIGWNEVFLTVSQFEDVPPSLSPLMNQTTKTIKINRNKKKPVIGDINEHEKIEAVESDKKRNDFIHFTKYMSKNNEILNAEKAVKENVELEEKNMEKAKNDIGLIYYLRNLASFYYNCCVCFGNVFSEKTLSFDEKLFFEIYNILVEIEEDIMKIAQNIFNELLNKNILSEKKIRNISKQMQINEKSLAQLNKKQKINDEASQIKNLKNGLRKFFESVFDLFLEFPEVLKEENNYDKEFLKLIKFFCLILNCNKYEDVTKEIKIKDLKQIFYIFYDKYENMDYDELVSEIKGDLNEIKSKK